MLANLSLVYLKCTRCSKLAAIEFSRINIMLENLSLVYFKCTRRSKFAAQHVNSKEFKFLTAYLI